MGFLSTDWMHFQINMLWASINENTAKKLQFTFKLQWGRAYPATRFSLFVHSSLDPWSMFSSLDMHANTHLMCLLSEGSKDKEAQRESNLGFQWIYYEDQWKIYINYILVGPVLHYNVPDMADISKFCRSYQPDIQYYGHGIPTYATCSTYGSFWFRFHYWNNLALPHLREGSKKKKSLLVGPGY